MMIGDAEAVFVDTSILVYATVVSAPWHAEAKDALTDLRKHGVSLWISRQILREYAAVVTRPQTFSLPLSAQAVAMDIQNFTTQFLVADESAAVTSQLVQLIQLVAVGGKQIHDANIVATMLVHGVPQLLTHNVDDFARYSAFITVQPLIPVM
jgi:predicted nucleic acid-binding protein